MFIRRFVRRPSRPREALRRPSFLRRSLRAITFAAATSPSVPYVPLAAVGLACAVGVAWTTAARADGGDARPTALVVALDAPSIDGAALERLLRSELGVPVSVAPNGGSPSLAVRQRDATSVLVVYIAPDGAESRRAIDLPRDRALATETVAFAASNLARDQAAELLATLRGEAADAAPADGAGPVAGAPSSPATAPPPPDAGATASARPAPPPTPSAAPAKRPPPDARDSTRDVIHDATHERPAVCEPPELVLGADFAPFVGTSSFAPLRARRASFNLIGGYTRGVNGAELGAGVNVDRSFTCGAQIAGLGNVTLGVVHGLQLALIDFARGDVYGAQIGAVAVVGGPLEGAQIGVIDVAGGSVRGAQVSVVGVAAGDVAGAQVGTVNVAGGRVHGVQIGVVNYADDSDASIGIVSIVRHGETSIDSWVDESGLVTGAVRHGGRLVHNVYGASYQLGGAGLSAGLVGIGLRIPVVERVHVDVDAIASHVQ